MDWNRHYHARAVLVSSFLMAMAPLAQSPAHTFYVSICNIKFDPAARSAELTMRIFTDDLEEAIVQSGVPRPQLNSDAESPNSDSLVVAYIDSRFSMRVNGEVMPLVFDRRHHEMDATVCEFHIDNVPPPEVITVENDILVTLFEAQSNVVRIRIGDKRYFLTLDRQLRKDTVVLAGKEE